MLIHPHKRYASVIPTHELEVICLELDDAYTEYATPCCAMSLDKVPFLGPAFLFVLVLFFGPVLFSVTP